MAETENLTAGSEEKNPQFGIDLLGLATVRVAKEGDHLQSSYLPFVSDNGDSAYLGAQTAGIYYLELWFEEGVLAEAGLDVVVLSKTFYNNKRHQGNPGAKNDLRRTGGEFDLRNYRLENVGGKNFYVYLQQFKVAPKGVLSGRLVAAENDNNLYVVLCANEGIQTYAISAYFDQAHGNGLYLTVEPVWTGAVGKVNGQFSSYVLERKRGGSPALFQILREHYSSKLDQLRQVVIKNGHEKEEIMNVSGLRAWDANGNLLNPNLPSSRATEIEVFSYMVSGPRQLSFGRDHWGRQIYLNWNNIIGVSVPEIRRVQNGAIVRCKFVIEPHTTHDHKPIDLVRGLEIRILSEEETQARIDELSKLGGQWVEWQDWFNDRSKDDSHEVKTRVKNSPQSVDRPRKHRKYFTGEWNGVPGAFGHNRQ